MKKVKNFLFTIMVMVIILMPSFVFAGEINFNDPVKKDVNVYTFTLTVEDVKLNYISGDIVSPNATITNITMSSGWNNATKNNNHFYFYHDGESSGNYTIATFEVTLTQSSHYEVKNLKYGLNQCQSDSYGNLFGENYKIVSRETFNKTCNISKDATLKSLSISSGNLSPQFDSNLELYSATVENNVTSVTFAATLNSTKAKIISGNTCSLKVGLNTCKIVVQAEAGNKKTYTITVTRKNKENLANTLSSDATITNLVVHGGTLTQSFKRTTYEYTIKPDKNAKNIYFTFEINSNKTKMTSNTCSSKSDICKLTITAEDGKNKAMYLFHILNDNAIAVQQNTTSSNTNSNSNSNSNSNTNTNSSTNKNTNSNQSINTNSSTTSQNAPTENKNGIQIEEDNYVDTEGNIETETTKPQAEENKTSSNKKEEKEQDENVTKEEEKIEIPFIHTKIEKSTLVKILIGLSIFAVILFIAIRRKIKD